MIWIAAAVRAGVTELRLEDTTSTTTWSAPLATFLDMATPLNRGHGDQLHLHDRYWESSDPRQLQLPILELRAATNN